MSLRLYSQSQALLPRQHAVHPAFLVAATGIEGGEGLGQLPETGVGADAIFGQEPLEQLATPGGKEDHALVKPIKDGAARRRPLQLPPPSLGDLGLVKFLEESLLFRLGLLLTTAGGRGLGVLAEKVLRPLGNRA